MDAVVRPHTHLPVYASAEEVVANLEPSYPVFCVRRHHISAVAQQFLEGFPGDVLYAVKCNPELHMLKTLFDAGIRHFDTASLAEVALVAEQLPGATSYFMHPVKSRAAIRSAHEVYGVNHYLRTWLPRVVCFLLRPGIMDFLDLLASAPGAAAFLVYTG